MCLRSQALQKSPLAKRRTWMSWVASLPRKWSIRKICSSAKTRWATASSLSNDSFEVPNGFS